MLSVFKRYTVVCAFLCSLCITGLPSVSNATDLTARLEGFAGFETFLLNQIVTIKVKVANTNVQAAANYMVRAEIFDEEGSPLYNHFFTATNLQPGASMVFTFPTWTAYPTGEYTMRATVTFDEEIDPVDNVDEIDFEVVQNIQDGLEFLARVLGPGEINFDTSRNLYFGATIAFPPGSRFRSSNPDEFDVLADDYMYFGWLESNKYQRFNHKSLVYTQRYGDPSSFQWYTITGWPIVNDVNFPADSQRSTYLLRGTEVSWPMGDTANISGGTSTGSPPDSVCALLVSGEPNNELQRDAFNEDLNLVENNLRMEPKGPRIPAGNITRIPNATRAQILNALHMMKDKCKKIIFYYTGHGSEGGMSTQSESTFYVDLWESLYNTGAKDLTVMIDACHSGSAIERAKLFSAYNERNVTVIASSSKDSSSWLDGVELGSGKTWTSGLYTWAWAKGFGNPEADYDSNGIVTEVEAHLWAMKLNPIKFGLPMDSLTKPQLHVHRAVKPVAIDIPVVMPDADLTITPKTLSSLGITISADIGNSIYGTYNYQPLDATVTDPSAYRIWNIKATGGLDYTFDLNFKYQPLLDHLPLPTTGYEPGAMTFDSTKITWKAHYPNVWDEISRSIQAVGVKHFSPWVLAMVKVQSGDVAQNETGSVLLSSYPNPFVGRLAVSIEPKQPDDVTIRVVDVTGRDALEPFTVSLGVSKYTINLDGSRLSAGSYNLIVQGEHTMMRRLIVKI